MGPAAFTAMANVIDNQRTILNLAIYSELGVRIPLSSWRGFLWIGVEVNFGDVVLRVLEGELRGVLIGIDHMLDLGRTSISVHIIRNKANAVPPPTVIGVRCSHAAPSMTSALGWRM